MEKIKALSQTLVALLLVFVFSGCMKCKQEPIKIGTNVRVGYEPLYLARKQGFFNDIPVSLVQMTSSADVIRAFRNKLIDCASLTLDEAFVLMQDDKEVRIQFVMDVSNGADALLAKPQIKSLKELKGKRVGVESSTVGAYTLCRALEYGRLKPNDISIVVTFTEGQLEAYLSGKLDAVVSFEPMKTKLIQAGANVLFDSHAIPNEILDVFVVRNGFYQSRKEDFDAIEEQWYRSLDYLQQDPDSSALFIGRRLGFSAEEFKNSLHGIKFPSKEENQRFLSKGFSCVAQRVVDIMLADRLLNKSIDTKDIVILK